MILCRIFGHKYTSDVYDQKCGWIPCCGRCESEMDHSGLLPWLREKWTAVARWFAQPAPKDVDDSDIPF